MPELDDTFDNTNRLFVRRIQELEVKVALERMNGGKAMSTDDIPIDVCICLGNTAIVGLTKLFNHIFLSNTMSQEWRKNISVPNYLS